jgi:hypothetical protein
MQRAIRESPPAHSSGWPIRKAAPHSWAECHKQAIEVQGAQMEKSIEDRKWSRWGTSYRSGWEENDLARVWPDDLLFCGLGDAD